MRVRRVAATLLASWLVLAVGLVALADKPPGPTINIQCPTSPGCHTGSGGGARVFGSGLSTNGDYWISFDRYPDGFARVDVNPDGTYSVGIPWGENDVGVHELCLTQHKGGSVRTLVCDTVVVGLYVPPTTTTVP